MTERGEQTLRQMQSAMEGRQSATLVAVTTLLDALAKKGETATLTELSSLVKCDSRLIARVIARANTMGVRPGAVAVTSLTEAFHLLGIDRLRSIVLSSLLAQHADSANHAQREMAVVSLTSGLVAQTMAMETGQDPGQAFLCGALRCYGELVLSTFRPDEFDLARAEAQSTGKEAEAFLHVFGITPNDLTQHLLEEVRVPHELLEAMVKPSSIPTRERHANPMLDLAIGSVAFSDLLFDPRLSATEFRRRAHEVLTRHAPTAAITNEEQLDWFLRIQQSHFAEYSKYVEFGQIAERPMVSVGQRINNVALARSPIVPGRISHHVQPLPEKDSTPIPWQPGTLRAEVLPRIGSDMIASDVLLFDLDPVIGAFRLSKGVGKWAVSLRGSRLFATGDKNLLGLCVALRQTLAINDAGEKTVQSHLPVWMRNDEAPSAFFVMPLGGGTITQVLLVGWQEPRKVVPPAAASVLGYNQAVVTPAA